MHDAPLPGFIAMPPERRTGAVAVGFSGGLDSTVLLHLLATSPQWRSQGLRAIHVRHGLHPEAGAWAAHCMQVCRALDVPLQVVRVDVDRSGGVGLEAAARDARHRAFVDALADDDVLALAHHRDDQAETFLLRALRASGADGLAAMRPWRSFGNAWLWRPLLDLPRTALRAYARAQKLCWIEDPGNADVEFDRNFLRHRVLPLLRERWPQADASLARAAALSAQASDLLSHDDAAAFSTTRTADPQVLSVDRLQALPPARCARVLRAWVGSLGLPPLPAHGVERIATDLLADAPGERAMFAWQGAAVRRWRGMLHAGTQRAPLPAQWQARWDGRAPLALPGDAHLRLQGTAALPAALEVRARRGGERITLPGRSHSHALKHVLQDLGIPPWRREQLPLLCSADGDVLAAGDLVHSATFDDWLRAHNARLVWTHDRGTDQAFDR